MDPIGGGISAFMRRIIPAIHKEVIDLAKDAADMARDRCPVDTGSLKRTIRVEDNSSGQDIKIEIKSGGMQGSSKFVDYAADVEYGTENMSAQPHMRPSATWFKKNFIGRLKQELK